MMVCSFPAGLSPLFATVFEFNQNEKEIVSFVPYPITINFNQYIVGMGNLTGRLRLGSLTLDLLGAKLGIPKRSPMVGLFVNQ
jgi:hypothetical protein